MSSPDWPATETRPRISFISLMRRRFSCQIHRGWVLFGQERSQAELLFGFHHQIETALPGQVVGISKHLVPLFRIINLKAGLIFGPAHEPCWQYGQGPVTLAGRVNKLIGKARSRAFRIA